VGAQRDVDQRRTGLALIDAVIRMSKETEAFDHQQTAPAPSAVTFL
jgi:hypothetical protein